MSEPRILAEKIERVPVSKLRLHEANPRRGDVPAIVESIRANGFNNPLLVQRSTGNVLAGNHRLKAAQEIGLPDVPVVYLDIDDEAAMRVLLSDNRTSDLGTYDFEALAQLLDHLASTDAGLNGTGYDTGALDSILSDLSNGPGDYGDRNKEIDPDDLLSDDALACPRCGFEFDE